MIAAVPSQGKVRFIIYPGSLSPQRLITFMQRLIIKDARRRVFLILDNPNVHKAKSVRE